MCLVRSKKRSAIRIQNYSSKDWVDVKETKTGVSWIQIHATMTAKLLQNNGKQSLVCGRGGGNLIV